ncbi:MAG TPA: Uma2 family endonuclease [Acetobacteraceae bacterium]|nr:Uma2 family endonuclease [Acetobacteraceae bacterium]
MHGEPGGVASQAVAGPASGGDDDARACYAGGMNVALRKPMTLPQFLAWEERQELRYEFDGVQPVARTGGTAAHSAIQRNLLVALGSRLRGKPCQPHGSELKIEVAGRIRYPDAFVVCMLVPPRATVVAAPVVVFEILSESTANTDLVETNQEYRATPSIRRYVIVEQDKPGAVAFVRKAEDWVCDILSDPGAMLSLPEIGIELPLAELYEGIETTAAETEAAG